MMFAAEGGIGHSGGVTADYAIADPHDGPIAAAAIP
jgi:hypothetical protein